MVNPCGVRQVTGWGFKRPWGPAPTCRKKKKLKKKES
jgi:hypothetical protein